MTQKPNPKRSMTCDQPNLYIPMRIFIHTNEIIQCASKTFSVAMVDLKVVLFWFLLL